MIDMLCFVGPVAALLYFWYRQVWQRARQLSQITKASKSEAWRKFSKVEL